jgi:hypothetical protein
MPRLCSIRFSCGLDPFFSPSAHMTRRGRQDCRYRRWHRLSSFGRICRGRFVFRVSACGNFSGRRLPRTILRTAGRRQRLRLSRPGSTNGRRIRHRNDRVQPVQRQTKDSGGKTTSTLPGTFESQPSIRVDARLPTPCHVKGTIHRKLPHLPPTPTPQDREKRARRGFGMC